MSGTQHRAADDIAPHPVTTIAGRAPPPGSLPDTTSGRARHGTGRPRRNREPGAASARRRRQPRRQSSESRQVTVKSCRHGTTVIPGSTLMNGSRISLTISTCARSPCATPGSYCATASLDWPRHGSRGYRRTWGWKPAARRQCRSSERDSRAEKNPLSAGNRRQWAREGQGAR